MVIGRRLWGKRRNLCVVFYVEIGDGGKRGEWFVLILKMVFLSKAIMLRIRLEYLKREVRN